MKGLLSTSAAVAVTAPVDQFVVPVGFPIPEDFKIVPAPGYILYDELAAVTRKAFVPRLFVQVMREQPSFNILLTDDLTDR